MTDQTETAILAGGCFWGAQELLRKRDGVISTRVGYAGGDVHQRHLPEPRRPRRGGGDRLRPRADLLPRHPRVLLPDPRPDDEEPTGQRRRVELSLGDLLHERRAATGCRGHDRRRRRLRPVAGQGRHRGEPAGPFWEAEPEHQDYLQRTRTATPATSCARTGSCRSARRPLRGSSGQIVPTRPSGATSNFGSCCLG